MFSVIPGNISILRKPTVHYRIHNSSLPVPILKEINPIYYLIPVWRSILILCSHLRLSLQVSFLSSGISTKTLNAPLLSPCMLHYPPISFFWFDHSNNIRWGIQIRNLFLIYSFPLRYLTLLGLNIFLSTLFSNILSLRFSFSMSDQVSHPHKTL
jgi:hypothetical protein